MKYIFVFLIALVTNISYFIAKIPANAVLVNNDGTYASSALEKDSVVIKIVQSEANNIQQSDDPDTALQDNLNKMVTFAEQACSEEQKPDFILYNEFPLTGYSTGKREEKLKYTIEVPGAETHALGEIAKKCDTYIIFGSYARDKDWPRHILSINTVIDRKGKIAKKFWKTRNVKRLKSDGEIPTTTIESVRDRYRAMYGIEEEFPVLRTEYGNIAVSTVQLDPMVFAAFAMRGTEIMFRTSTLFSKEDVMAIARFNNMYSAMSNIVFPPDVDWAHLGGNSLIVSPNGKVLAEAKGNTEAIITAVIPIAEFRKNRTIPHFPLDVVEPVFSQYKQEIPLNHLDIERDKLPDDRSIMKEYLDKISQWLN